MTDMDLTSEQKQRVILDATGIRPHSDEDMEAIVAELVEFKRHAAIWELWEMDLLVAALTEDGKVSYQAREGQRGQREDLIGGQAE